MDMFIDTDVIVDFLIDRRPFSDHAEKIFALLDQNKMRGHTTSLSFSKLYYLLRQQRSRSKSIALLRDLSGLLNILKVDKSSILQALDSDFNDFEDAIQFFSAYGYKKINLIVTRNIRDYKKSTIPVMSPETWLKTYHQTLKNN